MNPNRREFLRFSRALASQAAVASCIWPADGRAWRAPRGDALDVGFLGCSVWGIFPRPSVNRTQLRFAV